MTALGNLLFAAGCAVLGVWLVCAIVTARDLLSRDTTRPWKQVSLGFGRRDQMMVGEQYRVALAIATRWRVALGAAGLLLAVGAMLERVGQ